MTVLTSVIPRPSALLCQAKGWELEPCTETEDFWTERRGPLLREDSGSSLAHLGL